MCTACAPVVTRQDDASRMWSTIRARGRGSVGCARGAERCEGEVGTGETGAGVSIGGDGEGSEWRKVVGGAPVEWGAEMADNRWALVDEVSSRVPSPLPSPVSVVFGGGFGLIMGVCSGRVWRGVGVAGVILLFSREKMKSV